MTAPKKGSDQPREQDPLELQKKTLKDLPTEGEDVKGGRRVTTIGGGATTIPVSTVIC